MNPDRDNRRTILGICVFLAAAVWFVFSQTSHFEFINYDDDAYVYDNPAVSAGLTLPGVESAFHNGGPGTWDWVPLTTISHMADCQLFGLNAGGHHLTNVLLHAAAAILLFLVLRKMTGDVWLCAFVAALFAIHPLRVESVAWVTERKDVLSGVFFMLTLWVYAGYVRRPGSPILYLAVMFLFALGLMSKPMLVTMPFVLLLLDYWPLNRFRPLPPGPGVEPVPWMKDVSIPARLMIEKIPLLVLSAASCILAVTALGHRVGSLQEYSFPVRMGNALVSYVTYLWQMMYPLKLAVFYPYPANGWPLWDIIPAFMLLAAISLGVFLGRRKRPYLLVGWLWYLGMLVPVIGLFEAGEQAHADRFTYLPHIGLYLLLTWLIADLSARLRHRLLALTTVSVVTLVALIFCARTQASHWKNGVTLFSHTLAVTTNNDTAHLNLGFALENAGSNTVALAEYRAALKLDPGRAETHNNLANLLTATGHPDEAMAEYQEALRINPNHAAAHNNFGALLEELGRFDEAMQQYTAAALADPSDYHASYLTGKLLLKEGRDAEAIPHFRQTVQLNPNNPRVLTYLAQVLASDENQQIRDGNAALAMAAKANDLTRGVEPAMLDALAMAYAEIGQFTNAQQTADYALKLAASSDTNDVAVIKQRLQLYRDHQPFRQSFIFTNAPARKME